jgi:hypothetical protein
MPEKEICSPVTRKGSNVGSGQPLSPGARSNSSRGRADSVPLQPGHSDAKRKRLPPGEVTKPV